MKVYSGDNHEVKAVEAQKIANGALAVRLRCCDEEGTDHWHTLYAVHGLDEKTINAKLAAVAKDVAAQHASLNAAHAYLVKNFGEQPAPPSKKEPMPTMEIMG